MRELLKRMVIGTSLEPQARKVQLLFTKDHDVYKSRLYDIQTFEVLKRVLKRDSNCVDVGCHRGSILRHILRLAPKGAHFAFEPLPDMYQGLIESFGNIPGVHYL